MPTCPPGQGGSPKGNVTGNGNQTGCVSPLLKKRAFCFVRGIYIQLANPGGCETFEQQHALGEGDAYLYRLVSMSSEGLWSLIDEIELGGLDIEKFVAIADMWAGPFKKIPNISFTQIGHDFPPKWIAASIEEPNHVYA